MMSTTTPVTAEQLLELPRDGKRYELVAGELRVLPLAGWRHGQVVGKLHTFIGRHVIEHKLGLVFGAETGFLLARDPDTVRAPDVALILQAHLPEVEPSEAFWPGAPDLAVEVLSPGDKTGEVDEKIAAWLAAGSAQVWIVDPQLRTVTVYRSLEDAELLTIGQSLTGGALLPAFRCEVAEIF